MEIIIKDFLLDENVIMISEKQLTGDLFLMKDLFLLMKMLSYLHSVPTKSCSHSRRLRLLQQAHDHLVVVITSITMTTITITTIETTTITTTTIATVQQIEIEIEKQLRHQKSQKQ